MLTKALTYLRSFLAGPELTRAIQRNSEAADKLDQAVREVLNQ